MKFINGQLSLDSSLTGTTALFTSGLTVGSGQTSSSGIARGQLLNSNLTASANNDVLVGLDINPTFTNGAFSGLTNFGLRAYGYSNFQSGVHILPTNSIWSGGRPIQGALLTFEGAAVNYYAGYSSGSGFFHKFWTNATERVRIADGYTSIVSGNLLVGTTTDAGYKLDVNGTVRFTNQLTVVNNGVSIGNVLLNLNSQGTGTISSANSVGGATTYITMSGPVYYNPTSGVAGTFSVAGQSYMASGTATFNTLTVEPIINNTSTYSGIFRGFYYNPTLTSVIGTTHRAIETVTGDVILGSTSGNVGIGTSTLGTSTELTVGGGQAASSAIARGQLLNTTLTATSNNDVLVGLDIAPTFTNGAFTGVTNLALRVAYSSSRFISFTQRPGYADYGRIQFTNVTGADIYSSSRIDLLPNDTSQSVGLGNNITSQRLASSTNWGLYGPTAPGFLVGANAAFGVLSNNSDGNTDSFVFAGPTGSRHFFKVVQNDVPYFTIVPTGNVLINTTTDLGFKLSVSGSTLLRGSGTTSASYALATQNSSGGTTMVVNNAGNMLIGTTTDAGFKLDVNGSTRVKGNSLTISASGLSSAPANYVALNFDDSPNHHEQWFAIRSKKDIQGVSTGYDRIIFPTMGSDNSTWDFKALGNYSAINISATASGATLNLNNTSIIFNTNFKVATMDSTNRKLFIGNMSTDVHHLSVYDLVIKGAQPFEGNANVPNGGNVYIVGGTPSTSPAGNYGNVILAHDGTSARGSVLIGTITNNNSRLLIGGTVSGATLSTTRATHINATLLATGNTTTLIGLDIQPTFTPGSYTGLTQLALRVSGGTQIIGSGSTGTTLSVFSVDGSSGRLFDVSDDLSSTLFSVNTIAGLPVIEAFANSSVVLGKYGQNTLVVSGTSVGIGTSSPQAKLDVNGTSIFRTGVTMNSSLTLGNVDITSPWSAYTPTWTASVTNPVIGNGTITGSYTVIGKTCFVRGNIAMGSTTTFGSGEWYVSMPIPAINADAILLTATLLDNGSAWYNAIMVGARAGFNTKAPLQYVNITNGTASDVNPTQPFTWTNTDRFVWNGSYEIA
jgi:hypothetical protein